MLQLIDIKKDYLSADEKVEALKGINLQFRKNEFVSILGPSGCGKTTLLNMIGGLDHYTSGDLVIDGVSTKDYTDADWDAYRNHSIGFVFQSYNLIPHQSVLANVELALTLSGVSKAERRKRAIAVLEQVGLKDQIRKKPNQMSGGQMQRVAIARALVNNPDILLADEPTGALDSVTSVQIMELLKEIAKDRLVIMVTHNPALADEYSTRIIRLLDGQITDDSNPFDSTEEKKPREKAADSSVKKKPAMSFLTALSLSLNNLMTKKGRTILTAFAGSIGIIGIALILSLSNGINSYIFRVQEDTLSSYPISIQSENVDMSALITSLMGARQERLENEHELDAVYSANVMAEMMNTFLYAETQKNNLALFREYLQNSNILDYASNVQYVYDLPLNIYTTEPNGEIIKTDVPTLMQRIYSQMGIEIDTDSAAGIGRGGNNFNSMKIWQEILPGENGELVSPLLQEQYDLIYGTWPQAYNEALLIVNERNEVSDVTLGVLGLKSAEDIFREIQADKDSKPESALLSFSYEEFCGKEFKLIPAGDFYQKNADGTYTDLFATEKGLEYLYGSKKAVDLKICGVIRQNEEAVSGMLEAGTIGYPAALVDYLIDRAAECEVVKDQLADESVDAISGLPFKTQDTEEYTDEEKIALIREYLGTLSAAEKAAAFLDGKGTPSENEVSAFVEQTLANATRETLEAQAIAAFKEQEQEGVDTSYIADYITQMSDEELFGAVGEFIARNYRATYRETVEQNLAAFPQEQLAAMLTAAIVPGTENSFSDEIMLALFDLYMPATYSDSTLEDNLALIGSVNKETPSAINIYVKTFRNKDEVADMISTYNDAHEEADQISYTDYMALLMSSVSTIINAISYVLVAFAAISLIVSSIMIGIITYISVLERTKEIGILRAIGASKKDIARVFNAETIIEGFASGAIGILVTLLLILPINWIIRSLTGISNIGAIMPTGGAIALVIISIVLTLIAGLIPSRLAANKDPVIALQTE